MITKTCTKCYQTKILEEFSKASNHKHGRGSWCRICKNEAGNARRKANPQKYRDQKTAWRKKNPGYFLRKYWPGSTSEEAWNNYLKLLVKQDNKCAICFVHKDQLFSPLEVDHCHDTGAVRGLLCPNCNTAVGLLRNSPTNCISAAKYLKIVKFS